MATRQKTVEFISQSDPTNLAVSTNRDQTITAYIPEFSGTVTFRSVTLLCALATNATTAASLTTMTLGCQIGAGSMDTASVGSTVANSGERQSVNVVRDMTSRFASDWTSGTSKTITCRWSNAGVATANQGFKLIITYDYDDTQTTHIKTIRVPIESTRASLTTSMQTLGGATAIPAFSGGYLPEDSVVIRQMWVELWGDELASSAVATLQARVNGGSTTSLWLSTNTTINSSCWAHCFFDITSLDTSAARSLEVMSLTTTGRYQQIGGMVCVTYEFAPASTSTVYNSIILGAFNTAGWAGGTSSGLQDAWEREIRIAEPDTITLKESAMCLSMIDSAAFTATVGAGSQTPTGYSFAIGGAVCGNFTLVHRIDAGGQNGVAGITLGRGLNTYHAVARSGTANAGWNLAGFMLLNYTSGKASAGVGAHNQTRCKHIMNSVGTTALTNSSSSVAPAIPESDYWLTGVVANMYLQSLNSASSAQSWNAQRAAGEGEGEGWETIYVGQSRQANECVAWSIWGAARKSWRRYIGDPDTDRMDIETARIHRIDTNPAANCGALLWYTYHSQTWTVGGTISGSNGGTVNLYMHDALTGDILKTSTRSGNGAYSFSWYTDTRLVYTVAYEDGTHLGTSVQGYPA